MPASAVIPAPGASTMIAAIKTFVVWELYFSVMGLLEGRGGRILAD